MSTSSASRSLLSNSATRDFIRDNADGDIRLLALQGSRHPDVDFRFALDQIAGRQMARTKIPSWAAVEGVVYPPHLSMEQCSSEPTARYKASLVGDGDRQGAPTATGDDRQGNLTTTGCYRLVDLTGGFGVDFSFMARGFREAVYVERQQQLCAISSANFPLLGLSQAEVVCDDSEAYLRSMPHASLVFLDPARRDAHGTRTFGIADCTPNVLELMSLLLEKSDRVLLKLSPMLDWRKAVADITQALQPVDGSASQTTTSSTSLNSLDRPLQPLVRSVHIVSVAGECKELLILVERGLPFVEKGEGALVERGKWKEERDVLRIVCVNLLSDGSEQRFEYDGSMERSDYSLSSFHFPLSTTSPFPLSTKPPLPFSAETPFLLVPNASIMKAGCFAELSARFGIAQLEANSHLFVSHAPIAAFPGRQFAILRITSMGKRELREALAGITRANIAVRNFPLTPDALRRRLKLKDGGDIYIFATTLPGAEHRLFICRRC